MKAAELLVKCLEQQGIEYIFGVPGEENIDFIDALNNSSILGDLYENLECLTLQINKKEAIDPYFHKIKETITSDIMLTAKSDAFPMAPQRIIRDIQAALSSDDILLTDVGAHKLWIGRQYEALKPHRCIISNGLASMGVGLPGAIGAKLAFPDKKVLAVCGDGAFIMSITEFETAVRLKLAIVIIVWRDGRYGMIEWEQENKLGRSSNIQFNNPDFMALAKTYGAKGYKVEQAADLSGILQKAFLEDRPVIIDCPVDYTENFRLSKRLNEFKQMN
ncbi:acetolactate synthase-1/2/3 large subunit [Scopulibacillus darangshiensis]|uniref:Acetolactate synthase-1/2/3 large subunit n=1 Tax=Scopulibacillus darangshiensis TaxID=442528 RepID=A0A4R2P5M1_9BACL|nr:thiamine pyrophosphate-dependent enzyme [Scopulibacillus darangshiensis]TCP29414.1 acetolactate synthase-1/2/3 large subunit [Scopulibacillus darangshiensis]